MVLGVVSLDRGGTSSSPCSEVPLTSYRTVSSTAFRPWRSKSLPQTYAAVTAASAAGGSSFELFSQPNEEAGKAASRMRSRSGCDRDLEVRALSLSVYHRTSLAGQRFRSQWLLQRVIDPVTWG